MNDQNERKDAATNSEMSKHDQKIPPRNLSDLQLMVDLGPHRVDIFKPV